MVDADFDPAVAPAPAQHERTSAALKPGPHQFSLRDLFGLTTVAAIAAALVAAKGVGSLTIVLGLTIAYLNWRGRFARWQRSEMRGRLFIVAWILFGIALLLPSFYVFSKWSLGWEATWVVACAELDFIGGHGPFGHENWDWEAALSASGCTLLNLANLLTGLSPLWWWRLRRGRGRWLAIAFSLAAVSAWSVAFGEPRGFGIGHYVWCLSLTVLFLTTRTSTGTFIAMIALAVVFVTKGVLR